MSWEFNGNKPIYAQLVDEIKLRIISGMLPIGCKLGSVRDLAEEAGVNPNTMQRALAELEREKLVFSQRTSGRYVTDDIQLIKEMRQAYATNKLEELTTTLLQLGYSKEELMQLIDVFLGEEC